MRKIILYIATSIDGYIARPDGGIDWLFTDQDYGYREFFSTIDTVVMGRKTYEQALAFGAYPYAGTEGYVYSRTRSGRAGEQARFVSGDPAALAAQLRARSGKNIWLVGGAKVVEAFMAADLIDDYVISVHPVVLGSGIPLFRPPLTTTWLQFVDVTTFNTGLVQTTYSRKQR
ncbi:MAG: dihydrofolate reductase family protein [Nitrospiraceae bacterium]|nr:dihydrofolate reductase family protein [Nitrospiraceae bacterium]